MEEADTKNATDKKCREFDKSHDFLRNSLLESASSFHEMRSPLVKCILYVYTISYKNKFKKISHLDTNFFTEYHCLHNMPNAATQISRSKENILVLSTR